MPINPNQVEWDSPDPSKVEWDSTPDRSVIEKVGRQLGLTGRAALSGVGLGGAANLIGLPKPENPTERVVQDIAGTMAGGGAISAGSRLLAKGASAVTQPFLDMLAANPGSQVVAGAGAGAGGGIARESGAGPTGQMVSALAGGMALPAAGSLAKWAGGHLADTGATFGAAEGNRRGIERLARKAAINIAGDTRQEQLAALRNVSEYVPGVKPTVAEAIAEANIGQPRQIGGATIRLQKDLSGAQGLEDILPSAVRQQNVSIAEHVKNVKAETAPMRETALQQANAGGGVAADGIISKIEAASSVPGIRASDIVQKTLGKVKEKIAALAGESGRIDANDLYTVRKEVGNTIQQFSKETANWDKKLSGNLERQIQLYIDDAIEGSGGVGWKDYLKTYSSGMKGIESQLGRQREAKIIAAGIKGSGAQTMGEGGIPKPPAMLIREMMLTNWILKTIRQDPNTPVAKYVAEQMRDPEAYAKLLSKIPDKTGSMSDAARRASIATIMQQSQQP